jgi:predicted ATPase
MPRSTSASTGGRLLIIQGEAGIGKTRLAEEFLATVAKSGAEILSARCYAEQRALAYAPFVQALQSGLRDRRLGNRLAMLSAAVRAEAARLVPELAPPAVPPDTPLRRLRTHGTAHDDLPAAPDEPGAQARFLDAITQVVLALAHDSGPARQDAPGVLFLDDVQWLDEASLDLLSFLIRRLPEATLCILLAWRTEEVASDHALRRLYADELRRERAALISLSRLAQTDVQTLVNVAAQRGAPIHPALAERLYRESEGQPFFLTEALKQIERDGQLPADNALLASVRELLHSRLARVSETGRQLLSAAAVLGRSFDFEILDAVSGRSEQEIIEGVEELGAQGLIVENTRAGAAQ